MPSHDPAAPTAPAPRLDRRGLLKGAAGLGAASALGVGALAGPASLSALNPRVARAQDGTSTFTINGAPNDLDPHSQYDYNSVLAVRGMYEGLIVLQGSSTDQYEGQIAESWSANEDQSVYTFTLREGVTFQDGSPCDAQAVVDSYARLLTMRSGAWYVVGRFVDDPAKITAPDARTVVFDLGEPQPLFLSAMAGTYGSQVVNARVALANEVVDDEGTSDYGNEWMRSTPEGTGTGPYRITKFEPGVETLLERYDGYWGGWEGDHFDAVVIRAVDDPQVLRELLEEGDLDAADRDDVFPEVFAEWESNPDLRVVRESGTEVVYFTMTQAGPLASKEARQAMCYAFPYDEVIQGFFAGYAKQPLGPVGRAVAGHDPSVPQYTTDLARAAELLAAAGVEDGTELTVMFTNSAGNNAIGTLFQANLAELGITLTIEAVDSGTTVGTFYGELTAEERPDFFLFNWWPDYNDAWNQLSPLVESFDAEAGTGSANGGRYANPEVDRLLAATRDASTTEEYQTTVSQLLAILHDDPPAIYFAEPDATTALRADIQGFELNLINLFTYNYHKLSRATPTA